jgi:hypothetical protein
MDDEEWYLGKETPSGDRLPSGWEYLKERLEKLVATLEGRSDEEPEVITEDPPTDRVADDPDSLLVRPQVIDPEDNQGEVESEHDHEHRRLRDLPLLGAIAISNGIDRLRDRWRQRREEDERHRTWPYAVVATGGLALAGAGLYLLLDRAGAHHLLTTPPTGRTPSTIPPITPPSVPKNGHLIPQVPRGTEVFGPLQTSELSRNWATGSNAHHILHFASGRRGHVLLQLEAVSPDGSAINGQAIDLSQAANLRANITVNVNGSLNTISVPMHGDSLDLHGNLAKLIQSGKFSTVEVVRQHGNSEAVFSTVPGNGRSISARAFRSYLNQVQQQTITSGGGSASPYSTPAPIAAHKLPPTIIPAERGESPNDDTGFWHNPIVDGTMIATGLIIAGGAAVAAGRNRHRTTEEVEEGDEPQRVGLDIFGADAVSLPAEREQEYAKEVQGILHEGNTTWLRPGRSREEYITDFTPVAEAAVNELGGDMPARDRGQLVNHLVNEYCAGTPEEIYARLRGLSDAPEMPTAR